MLMGEFEKEWYNELSNRIIEILKHWKHIKFQYRFNELMDELNENADIYSKNEVKHVLKQLCKQNKLKLITLRIGSYKLQGKGYEFMEDNKMATVKIKVPRQVIVYDEVEIPEVMYIKGEHDGHIWFDKIDNKNKKMTRIVLSSGNYNYKDEDLLNLSKECITEAEVIKEMKEY
jgi:hypothetical protein